MAKKQGKVYLGYEDEPIGDKHQTLLTYTVNKIGGLPVSVSVMFAYFLKYYLNNYVCIYFSSILGLASLGKCAIFFKVPALWIVQVINCTMLCSTRKLSLSPYLIRFCLHQPKLLDTIRKVYIPHIYTYRKNMISICKYTILKLTFN